MYKYILVLILVGCGQPEAEPLFAWDGTYRYKTELGIYIKIDTEEKDLATHIDYTWERMQECTNIYIDPDRAFVIEYTDEPIYVSEDIVFGIIHLEEIAYSLIRKQDLMYSLPTTKHEMVHFLLYLKTGNADAAHMSDYFDNCRHY